MFFKPRFFTTLTFLAFVFFAAYFIPLLLPIAYGVLALVVFLTLLETVILWSQKKLVTIERDLAERFSNDDENWVPLKIKNLTAYQLHLKIIEELPHQLNLRDFVLFQKLKPKEKLIHSYSINPKTRGMYRFGNLNAYLCTIIGMVEKKQIIVQPQEVKIYPSFKNLEKYDLKTIKASAQYGIRKTRRIGHSLEFEQIKNYNRGDDIRHINWKATAKRKQLMVNQYTDEKSKEVYCLIDTGRNMKFPFKGLSLLDYSINSALIILNNALKSQDKAGVLSFNKKVENFLKAEQRPQYLQKILEKLYAIVPEFEESNFSNLYVYLKRMISHRSLLFLFTNFENFDSFERQLSYLQALNKSHVVVLVFFKNVEIEEQLAGLKIKDAVQKAIIEKQINEKKAIVTQLNRHRIQTVLTSPDELTIDLLNKYLEIKAKSLV